MSQGASKHSPYRWLYFACLGVILAYLSTTQIPRQIYRLAHRGLRRHGAQMHPEWLNRRTLNLRGPDEIEGQSVTMTTGHSQLVQGFGEQMYRYFTTRDKDNNGFLDPEEFKEFLRLISPVSIPYHRSFPPKEERSRKDSDVQILANFVPLNIDTLTKAFHENYASNVDYFRTLLKWQKPHRRSSRVSVNDLLTLFYPKAVRNLTLGEPFYLNKGKTKATDYLPDQSEFTNRYYPPENFKWEWDRLMSRLLGAFHERAFPFTRYTPTGSAAVVRARNEDYIQIYFRIHAEFQLNEPPEYPFWFTPSYFVGEITFSRDLTRVLDLQLDIPKERTLNVDMEWVQLCQDASPYDTVVEVDIGYIPKMQLKMKKAENVSAIKWTKEISTKKAFKLVERQLYQFKKIDYVPFEEAFIRAEKEKKLVHSVVLWGSLDDQSC